MKEIMVYHRLDGKWIKYTAEEKDDYVVVTGVCGYRQQDPPAYPGAPFPEPTFRPDGTPSRTVIMDKTFMIALARFYLRVAQPKNPPKFPWQGPL